jgi:CheY-like chemotaxis protein
MPKARAPVPDLVLWLVDDTPDHHATVEATVADLASVRFEGFLVPALAVERYRQLAAGDPQRLPRVVLMDFFLGSGYGNLVTRELRALQPPDAPLIIVGYSSMASASKAIVEAGGNLVIRKMRDRTGRNPLLERYLRELIEAIRP